MKTFKMIGMALVAIVFSCAMSACSDDDSNMKELEKEYARLIVGKWFNFTPEVSAFMDYKADGSYSVVAFNQEKGWMTNPGYYHLKNNQLINIVINPDSSAKKLVSEVEITEDKFIVKPNSENGFTNAMVHYRVQESFDIKGSYTYLNSVVRVVAKAGKTELKLPEGVTLEGKNSISIETMNGERIIEQMQMFFANVTFTADGKLNHTVDGETKIKNYTHNGNNLTFDFYNGQQLHATSFPDEDGDRLFIILPKQGAWVGGLADVIRKENSSDVLTDEVIASLEKEFMDTFETFTVVLSLSKE